MNVKIAAVAAVCALILIPGFPVHADQGAVVSVNGKVSASPDGNTESAGRRSFKVLSPDKFFSFRSLDEDNHYAVTLFVAGSIQFELGEDFKRKAYWKIDGYDPEICQLAVRHVHEGVLDWQGDRARIKLQALRRGYTNVVFSRNGKRFTVHLTVK